MTFYRRPSSAFTTASSRPRGDWALVLAKVSLGDLFYAKVKDYSAFRTCTNKIDRKHVDYLLYDPQTVRPVLGVELDDGSHQRRDRQARDGFVDQVFAAAQLPLVRVPARRAYNVAEGRRLQDPRGNRPVSGNRRIASCHPVGLLMLVDNEG